MAVPIVFYVSCPPPFDPAETAVLARAVATGYLLLPVIVVAGIGIFPLTLAEGAVVALVVTGALSAAIFGLPARQLVISREGVTWILALLAAISCLTSMSQSGFLVGLLDLSARDPLTGCLTRRIGEQLLEALVNGAVRRGGALTVAFLDLDHFKSVNDAFGHRQGDRVLQAVAQRLTAGVRRSDFVVRWGGEEFLIILPEADAAAAAVVTRRLFASGFGVRPDGREQTASIGIAECRVDGIAEAHALVDRADQRMYEAKLAGRGRAVGP
jgi:diguanylate cyclase